MRTATLLLFTWLLVACTAEKQKATLTPSNLESFYVTIDPNKDTLLRTPKGAAIQIKKGTFKEQQELEIKEAYTMKEMLLAGLVTESNGAPLRSGGMIYINTKTGEDVTLRKPITVLLPTNGVEAGMELFKGEAKGDSINWIKTDTIQPTVSEEMLSVGKAIYKSNCLTCHNIKKNLTGPALGGVQSRGPWKEPGNIVRWVHNPGRFIPTTTYTQRLAREHNGQIMPYFPQLSEYDIRSTMAFIRNESQKIITDTFRLPQTYVVADTLSGTTIGELYEKSCSDTTYYSERDSLYLSSEYVSSILDEPFKDTFPKIEGTALRDPSSMQDMRIGFTDVQESDGAYRFEIKTLGWYNVDALVAGLPGTMLCDLRVRLQGTGAAENISVYAFFPQQKNLSVGVPHGQGNYYFDKVSGKIPLYLGEKGIVVAFGNRGNQFYYGTVNFTVKGTQVIVVDLKPASEETFLNAIKAEKIEGINLDVSRQKMRVTPCGSDSSRDISL